MPSPQEAKNKGGVFDRPKKPTATHIEEFNTRFGESRDLLGFGEKLHQFSRLVQTLVTTDNLSIKSLSEVFQLAHQNFFLGATYLLAYEALAVAATTGKLNSEMFRIVEASVMTDEDPLWSSLGRQQQRNTQIMQRLLGNPQLFELMQPYMIPDEYNPSTEI